MKSMVEKIGLLKFVDNSVKEYSTLPGNYGIEAGHWS
jgi:hypothetical protein